MRNLAIIWGLDGTLLDNDSLQFDKLKAACTKHGVSLTRKDYDAEHGFNVPDGDGGFVPAAMPLRGAGDINTYFWLIHQKPSLEQSLPLALWLEELHAYVLAHQSRLAARVAVPGLIKALHSQGIPQAVVTNASRAHTELGLRSLGDAARAFSFVVTADHLPRTKPAPDGLMAAAARLETAVLERHGPESKPLVVVIDDCLVGVLAAHRAGLPCVQFLLPGQVPLKPEVGNPGLRAARRCPDLADTLMSLAGL